MTHAEIISKYQDLKTMAAKGKYMLKMINKGWISNNQEALFLIYKNDTPEDLNNRIALQKAMHTAFINS